MKKLLLLVVLAAVAYGVWQYLQQVNENAARKRDRLKSPSEKVLKDMDREQSK
jgi:hypothetical protein